jgi:uncharacterized protein YkwD
MKTFIGMAMIVGLCAITPQRAQAQTFNDVAADYWAFSFIETLASSGITAGCSINNYCPAASVTRAQMAVFLERGIRGSSYVPDPGAGDIFLDVPSGYWAGGWIELLSADGITTGCGINIYCPEYAVTREQMAVFLLRAKHGQDYAPPTPTGVFDDIDLNHWSAPWIEQLYAEGITTGCGNDLYCPKNSVTRAQMAVFLVRAFNLGGNTSYNLGDTSQNVIDQCMSENDKKMLTQVNTARSQPRNCGSKNYPATTALSWHCTLEDVAYAHSRDMGDHNFFNHTGSDGLTVDGRVTNEGYDWSALGENIAAGQQTIDIVMAAWLDSPGHCANIMHSVYTEFGAGSYNVDGSDYPIYWTQVFAKPRM